MARPAFTPNDETDFAPGQYGDEDGFAPALQGNVESARIAFAALVFPWKYENPGSAVQSALEQPTPNTTFQTLVSPLDGTNIGQIEYWIPDLPDYSGIARRIIIGLKCQNELETTGDAEFRLSDDFSATKGTAQTAGADATFLSLELTIDPSWVNIYRLLSIEGRRAVGVTDGTPRVWSNGGSRDAGGIGASQPDDTPDRENFWCLGFVMEY